MSLLLKRCLKSLKKMFGNKRKNNALQTTHYSYLRTSPFYVIHL